MSLDILLCATAQNDVFARRLLSDLQRKNLPVIRTHLAVQPQNRAPIQLPTGDKMLEDKFPVPRGRLVLLLFASDLELRKDNYSLLREFLERDRGRCIVIVGFDPRTEHRTRVFWLGTKPEFGVLIDLNTPDKHPSDVLRLLLRLHDGNDPERLGRNFEFDTYFSLPDAEPEPIPKAVLVDEAAEPMPIAVPEPMARVKQQPKATRGPRVIGARILPVFIIMAMISAIAYALLY